MFKTATRVPGMAVGTVGALADACLTPGLTGGLAGGCPIAQAAKHPRAISPDKAVSFVFTRRLLVLDRVGSVTPRAAGGPPPGRKVSLVLHLRQAVNARIK